MGYLVCVCVRASKYTDLSVFLRISDYKYGRNFENTESFGQLGKHYNMWSLGQSNYIVSFSSTRFYISMRAGGHYSLFIIQYYGILRVWFPGTAQIISKKEVWLVFQGNNEGRSGRLKQTWAVTRN